MRRTWSWGLAAVILGLMGAAQAAEGFEATSVFDGSQNPAFRRWGGVSKQRPRPTPPPQSAAAKSRANDSAAAVRAQEEANLFRRMAVCDKLRSLALETGDDSLEKQAEVLQSKADAVYKQRTSVNLGSGTDVGDGSPREGKR